MVGRRDGGSGRSEAQDVSYPIKKTQRQGWTADEQQPTLQRQRQRQRTADADVAFKVQSDNRNCDT